MLRSLIHYRRLHLAVLLGAAVTTAVLAGALLTGDSVKGSLRDLALDRLGRIDRALVADRFVREDLAGQAPGAAPAILLRGAAVHASSRARAAGVQAIGIDERFTRLYPEDPAVGVLPPGGGLAAGGTPAVVNETLARDLGAREGDALLVHVPRRADAPADSLLGRRATQDLVSTLRVTVRRIVPDRGAGRFGLDVDQRAPRNLYVPLESLQRAAARPGQANVILFPAGGVAGADPDRLLDRAIDPEAMGLLVSRTPAYVSVESRQFVLRPDLARAIEEAALSLGAEVQRVQTYLATEIRSRSGYVPYSTISAVSGAGSPFPGLFLTGGEPAPTPDDGEILLSAWAAEDLDAQAGTTLEMSYFVVDEREQLLTRTASFRVKGILATQGLAIDRTLTPEYPGIEKAKDIASWDPPFPVNLSRVRPRDEEYWDLYGATPKGFVSEGAARRLWSTRYGALTSVRAAPADGGDLQEFERRLAGAIRERVPIEAAGLRLRPLRDEALRGAEGSTDFGALFLAFSFFLIVSCALLCGLLFRLGVERRAREIGVLLATGHRVRRVRSRFLSEGLVLAAAGAVPGLAGGVLYAGLLMLGLRTIWRGAVGSSELYLHVEPASLLAGGGVAIATVTIAIAWSLGRLRRLPIPALLAGRTTPERGSGRRGTRASSLIATVCGGVALVLLVASTAGAGEASPALAFGMGGAALTAGLALFARWTTGAGRRSSIRSGRWALASMAARNSAWNPGRSLLSIAMIASACFVIVTVAASRREATASEEGGDSATGGYRLMAEAEIPVHQDLSSPEGRSEAGLDDSRADLFAGATLIAMRTVPGDEASCLNLYRPERPRLLGVPAAMIERGGFRFHDLSGRAGDPWRLLEGAPEPGVIPVFGDEATVTWILHMKLGEDLVITDETGGALRLRIVGLLEGSPFQSELLVSEKHLLAHFPSRAGYARFLIDVPPERAADLSRALEEELAPHGFDVSAVADRIAGYREVENTYLATFQVLGGLGLLLGTIGLGIVALRNVAERRGELAALRAFGFSRRRVARMVVLETLSLLLLGLTIGTLSALAAVAPRLVSGGAPWGALGLTLGGVLAFGMLSSLGAVSGALRAPLLPALKSER